MTPHPYQADSIEHLIHVLRSRGSAVDGSDCGTGKTLVATEVYRRLNLPSLVVCPKPVIPTWHRHAESQGTDVSAINWEMVRTGRTPFGDWQLINPRHRKKRFVWNAAVKFLVFDEIHRAMSYDSKNSELVRAARRQRIPTIGLSATLADTPVEMDALGYLLDLHEGERGPTLKHPEPYNFLRWAHDHGCRPGLHHELTFCGTDEKKRAIMAKIHKDLYPARGVRVRIPDLGDAFPETQILSELYELGDTERVNALYAEMERELAVLEEKKADDIDTPLTRITRARQEIELLKVPVMAELAKDYEAQGMSVALFVNYTASLQALCERLDTDCFIDGTQVGTAGSAQREANRKRFHEDVVRFIVCNGEAGGLGLDLHDIYGRFPRVSLISPGYNAKTLQQIFGRVCRSGGKSKSLQRIILALGTVEEKVHRALESKRGNLRALNDGVTDGDLKR